MKLSNDVFPLLEITNASFAKLIAILVDQKEEKKHFLT